MNFVLQCLLDHCFKHCKLLAKQSDIAFGCKCQLQVSVRLRGGEGRKATSLPPRSISMLGSSRFWKFSKNPTRNIIQIACSYLVQRLPWCTLSPKRSGLRLRSYGSQHSMKKPEPLEELGSCLFSCKTRKNTHITEKSRKILVDLKKGPHQILVQNLGKILKTRKNSSEIREN